MRALRVTLHTNRPITLPIAYNELVQGLLYSCWRDNYPQVHDTNTARPFRPFVFGRLEGRSRANGKERTIIFDDYISFEVRSPIEELLDECAKQLASRDKVRLGAHELDLADLQSNDRLLFPPRVILHMRTPVVAYQTLNDGHTQPFSPTDAEWLSLVTSNARYKADMLGLTCDSALQAIALSETLRKHVTRFKGTYVTGWTGDILLACSPQMLTILWCCGIGAKNSQGFGLFDFSRTFQT